jgi:hypothetical protein
LFASNSNASSKPNNKKKNKQSKPKAVAPTVNDGTQLTGSNAKGTKNNSSSDAVENRFQQLEKSGGELSNLMKKFASTNMLGMVHKNVNKSKTS